MPDNENLYGIVARHRGDWWFVSSKDIDERPTCVYRLTETLSPTLADWIRTETGDPALTGVIPELRPDETLWAGEFRVGTATADIGRHTIDAHPWGAVATDREPRNALIAIDIALRPLPRDFTSVLRAEPPAGPVLAIRLADNGQGFEVLSAQFAPLYRPRNPWITLQNDPVTDSGSNILGWRAASEWFDPVSSET